MALSKYHRDRPFLIINRKATPEKGQKTESKNWSKDAKWTVEEHVSIVDRVTTKHLTESTIIIDILKRDLIKNRFTDAEDSDVLHHYLKEYKAHITDGLSIWMRNRTTDLENTEILIHDLEDEIGKMDMLHKIPVNIVSDNTKASEKIMLEKDDEESNTS